MDDVVDFGRDVGHGIANTAEYAWNNPGQSAKNVATWTGDALKGLWTGVTNAYDKGGVAQAGGHLAATALGIANPLRKAKAAGEGLELASDVAKAEHRLKEAEEAGRNTRKAEKTAVEDSKDGSRVVREIPIKDVECFNKPSNVKTDELLRQLKEQEDALNNTTAETLLARRQAIRDAGGTSPLRDIAAQSNARIRYEAERFDALRSAGKTRSEARSMVNAELETLAATHRLDIIAGGDPSDISGMGDRSVNSSMGSQWKGRRSQSLEDYAKDLDKNGVGKEKMRVKLRMC
ncbi:polymorphic toxin type 15 domain-containing protein [Rhizobium helianthi]|uniref:Polymorphic toxin type 15 domain-containing protein n=1 Tax=Rhizobium helianthi TaxID=1132695 RepID=A0ABW4LXE2_9HYPH